MKILQRTPVNSTNHFWCSSPSIPISWFNHQVTSRQLRKLPSPRIRHGEEGVMFSDVQQGCFKQNTKNLLENDDRKRQSFKPKFSSNKFTIRKEVCSFSKKIVLQESHRSLLKMTPLTLRELIELYTSQYITHAERTCKSPTYILSYLVHSSNQKY